jgi:hypothetical protein
MGQSAAATVREIEDIRGRLDAEMRELERRMPQPAVWAKRAVGVAVGGGITGLVLMSALRRRRKKRREATPIRIERPVVHVVPEATAERVSAALSDGRWKPWAAAGAGVWLAMRLLEVRQLRQLNRRLVDARV